MICRATMLRWCSHAMHFWWTLLVKILVEFWNYWSCQYMERNWCFDFWVLALVASHRKKTTIIKTHSSFIYLSITFTLFLFFSYFYFVHADGILFKKGIIDLEIWIVWLHMRKDWKHGPIGLMTILTLLKQRCSSKESLRIMLSKYFSILSCLWVEN